MRVERISAAMPPLAVICGFLGLSLFAAANSANDKQPRTAATEAGFVRLFDGTSLDGWEGNRQLWKVEDDMIVGESPGILHNDFLATEATYSDFELRLEFRLHQGKGNSGVQFRSKRVAGSTAVEGYQADIGQQFWGCLYDEHRRRRVLVAAPQELEDVLHTDHWNTYVIRAQGDRIVLKINGLKTVDYRERDGEIAKSGIIALQIHSGPAMRIDFRNIRINDLSRR